MNGDKNLSFFFGLCIGWWKRLVCCFTTAGIGAPSSNICPCGVGESYTLRAFRYICSHCFINTEKKQAGWFVLVGKAHEYGLVILQPLSGALVRR